MPAGVGYPGGGGPGVKELAAAGSSLGIPQSGAVPGGDLGGLGDLLSQLSSGQLSPEKMLMLLALLAGSGGVGGGAAAGPQGPPPGAGPGGPIGAAMGAGGLPPGMMP